MARSGSDDVQLNNYKICFKTGTNWEKEERQAKTPPSGGPRKWFMLSVCILDYGCTWKV